MGSDPGRLRPGLFRHALLTDGERSRDGSDSGLVRFVGGHVVQGRLVEGVLVGAAGICGELTLNAYGGEQAVPCQAVLAFGTAPAATIASTSVRRMRSMVGPTR